MLYVVLVVVLLRRPTEVVLDRVLATKAYDGVGLKGGAVELRGRKAKGHVVGQGRQTRTCGIRGGVWIA